MGNLVYCWLLLQMRSAYAYAPIKSQDPSPSGPPPAQAAAAAAASGTLISETVYSFANAIFGTQPKLLLHRAHRFIYFRNVS